MRPPLTGSGLIGDGMIDNFPYVYDRGHWVRDNDPDDGFTLREIASAALSCFALVVCLVWVTILFLLG